MDIANFQKDKSQNKLILKHVTTKFIVQKQQFHAQFKMFLKTRYNVSRYLGENLRADCVQKFFLKLLNIKNTRDCFKIVQK